MTILVAYVTAGAGHRRAAEALAQALRDAAPEATVECVDVLTCSPRRFHAFYAQTYLFLVRHLPWVWKISYRLLDHLWLYRVVQPLRRWWNLRITRRFTVFLRERAFDAVVVTHFLPADVCSAGKRAGWLTARLVVVVTDLYPHRFWLSPEADAVVVSTAESAEILRQRQVVEARIHVRGIPIGKPFLRPIDQVMARGALQLHPQRLTVLVTSGGTTVGSFERVVESLLALEESLPGRLQLLVVCGEDEATRHRLAKRAQESAMPMRVFGFVDNMAELMGASDLIVSKAGGLTVSEALARGRPLVLYHVIPGQEQLNARYVARHGAGCVAPHLADVALAVRRCVEDSTSLQAMAAAARALGHPNAASAIAADILQLVRG